MDPTHDCWAKGLHGILHFHGDRETPINWKLLEERRGGETHQLHRRSHAIALGTSNDTSISRTTPLSRLQAPQVAIVWPKYAPSSIRAVDEAMIKFQGRSALKQTGTSTVYTGREATPTGSTRPLKHKSTTFSRLSNCWKTWRRMAFMLVGWPQAEAALKLTER